MVSMMVNTEYVSARCNTGLTTPRHAEYQIINLILGNITPLVHWTRRKTSNKTTVVVSTMHHALYSRLIVGDSELGGATCAVTSTHITIILESLPKHEDNTLGDSMFLGYFQLGTSTFQSSSNSTT
ncbi:uncharacterized protein TNCV_796001 [Trichonephila clavipes]|nr:uncharacterized protein TNCV_796001 [Trichonephila clavipes]